VTFSYLTGSDLSDIQHTASHRYIHPHSFSWPASGSDRDGAGLPLLDWAAAPADQVADAVRKDAKRLLDGSAVASLCLNSKIAALRNDGSRTILEVENLQTGECREQSFDVVILCVGFGDESYASDALNCSGYWEQDALLEGPRGRTLVSGIGDGGLIDCIRAATSPMSHHELIEFAHSSAELIEIGEEISSIEEAELKAHQRNEKFESADAYHRIEVQPHLIEWANRVASTACPIYLNHRGTSGFSLSAAPINKALLLALIRAGCVSTIEGNLVSITKNPDRFLVEFQDGSGISTHDEFDEIIIRHGPDRKEHFLKAAGEWVTASSSNVAQAASNFRISESLDQTTDAFFWPDWA